MLLAIAGRLAAASPGARLRASGAGRLALEVARFIVCVAVPYTALMTGAFAPSDVGLQGSPSPELALGWTPDQWVRAAGHAGVLAALTVTAMVILTRQIRRAGGYAPAALDIDDAPIARLIRDGAYAEVHWSFYRALPMIVLTEARWAALAGLGLATIEALLAGWLRSGTEHTRLFEAAMLSLSAAYFALTGGQVWIAIVLQIGVRIAATKLAHAGYRAERSTDLIA